MRDSQRSKVYRAERAAFAGTPNVPRSEEAWNKYARLVVNSEAARKVRPHTRFVNIVFRGRNWSRAWSTGEITLGSNHRGNEWVVLHEVSHVLTPGDHHGRKFAACYLSLVYEFLGRTWGDKLKAEFKVHGVKHRPKKQLSPERLAALREHGRQLAAARAACKKEGAL